MPVKMLKFLANKKTLEHQLFPNQFTVQDHEIDSKILALEQHFLDSNIYIAVKFY